MSPRKHKATLFSMAASHVGNIYEVCINEFREIFRDRGVIIILLVASLIYPILYPAIYKNETLTDVPVAAVDNAHSRQSAELLRRMDATPDICIAGKYDNMEEAKKAFDQRKVHGIIHIPADFDTKLSTGQPATISTYCDMSSFMYYRAMIMSTNYSVLNMNQDIKVERLNTQGIVGESAAIITAPILSEGSIFFNSGAGFASFLMPAILILIIHQTLFFGIGMLAGTAREDNRFHTLVSSRFNKRGLYRIIIGKSLAFFILYLFWSVYIVGFIPHFYNLPHIGSPMILFQFMIPFLLATIFFSMTISVFIPNRESGMTIFLFFSLILLFLSGISWPASNINGFWRAFAWIFPSTHGIQGYLKINSMGAGFQQIEYEMASLWAQTAFYFATTILVYNWQIKKSRKKAVGTTAENLAIAGE